MSDTDLPEKMKSLFARIDEELARRQKYYSDEAVHLGYTRDVFRNAGIHWIQAAGSPSIAPSTWSALDATKAIGDTIAELNQSSSVGGENRGIYSNALYLAASTGSAFVNAAGVMHTTDGYKDLFSVLKNDEYYGERLSRLDPALGMTYKAINEVIFGTTSDPNRGGLFLVRQAFDEYFGKLAPDHEVRSSQFWKPKGGDKPDQIYRRERINYAAHRHARDRAHEVTLAATAGHLLKIYEELNEAHNRGVPVESQCKDAIRAMKNLLQEWIDEIS